jgi:hypothetical protein
VLAKSAVTGLSHELTAQGFGEGHLLPLFELVAPGHDEHQSVLAEWICLQP